MGQAGDRGRGRAAGALALVLAAALGSMQAAPDGSGPEAVGREIAAALRAGSAARLAATLPSGGRVRAELPTLAPAAAGLLSPTQCRYLLEDILDRLQVTGFEATGLATDPDGGRAVLSGLLTARSGEDGDLALEMRLVLAREDGAWVLREIAERPRRAP